MALHSTLLWSLVAFALVAGLAYLAGRAVGRWLPRDDPERAGTRARRSLWVLMPLTYVAALFAMTAGGWLDLTDRALAALPTPGPVEGFLGLVLAFGVPALAVVAPYLGVFPAVREARDIEMTTGAVALTLVRYLVGLVALLAAALLATGGTSVVAGPTGGLLAGVAVVILALYAGSPLVVALLTATRRPTDRERDRLEAARSAAGLSVRWVRVQETRDAGIVTAFVRGLPRARALFVTDDALADLDDDELAALLSIRAGRVATFHTEIRLLLVVWIVLAAGSTLLFDGVVGIPVFAAGGVAAGVALLWLGRRLVFRADDHAAERVGATAVADAIETVVARNDSPRTWGPLRSLRRMEPTIERRLARLRTGSAGRERGDRTGDAGAEQ